MRAFSYGGQCSTIRPCRDYVEPRRISRTTRPASIRCLVAPHEASVANRTYTAATGTLDNWPARDNTDPLSRRRLRGRERSRQLGLPGCFFRGTLPCSVQRESALHLTLSTLTQSATRANPARFGAASTGNGIAFNSGKPIVLDGCASAMRTVRSSVPCRSGWKLSTGMARLS